MTDRRNLIWLCATPMIAVGLLLLVFLPHDFLSNSLSQQLVIGFIFGTLFGHTTLAAAWTSFGPLTLFWRLPLSLLWMVALTVAFACNFSLYLGPSADGIIIAAACMGGQFLFLLLSFWGLALTSGRRLQYRDASSLKPDPKETQIGIRQLTILTIIVAVVLGVGAIAVTRLSDSPGLEGVWAIFIFLAVAAIVVTLPLILAALLPRLAIPAVALVLVLVGALTAFEVPLLEKLHRGSGPETLQIVFINGFTSTWILAVVLLVRISGYRLSTPKTVGVSA